MVDWIPARVSLCLLVATGVMVLYVTRINLSVAIIKMVKIVGDNHTSTTASTPDRLPYCLLYNEDNQPLLNNYSGISTQHSYGENGNRSESFLDVGFTVAEEDLNRMLLTTTERGAILGAFFYGYFLSAIAGGCIADRYGTKRVFGIAVLADGLINLLIPLSVGIHYSLLIIFKLCAGLFQGMCYPSLHSLMAVWIPPLERSRFIAFAYYANCLGIIITMPVCGLIVDTLGWEAVFYISGAVSLTWVIVWVILMHDRPEDHPRISNEERSMIIEAIRTSGSGKKPKSIPWLQMLMSIPLWAISMAHSGNMFGYNLLVTQLPTYMNSIVGLSIRENAALSSMPFLSRFLGSNFWGWIGSFLVKKEYLQPKSSKKIFNIMGLIGPGVAIVLAGYAGCNAYATLAFFTLGTFLNGGVASGYMANHLDIAPNFAGTCMGFSNTVAFGISMAAPVVIGALTPDETIHQWRHVFWIAFGIYLIGTICFTCFSSVEVQPWNNSSDSDEDEHEELKIALNENRKKIKITALNIK